MCFLLQKKAVFKKTTFNEYTIVGKISGVIKLLKD